MVGDVRGLEVGGEEVEAGGWGEEDLGVENSFGCGAVRVFGEDGMSA